MLNKNKLITVFLAVLCAFNGILLYKLHNMYKFIYGNSTVKSNVSTVDLNTNNESKESFNNSISVYPSVEAMLSDISLRIGMTVQTLGYYSINDGGAALYTIREKKTDDMDDSGSVIFLRNGSVAELITDGKINIRQFGAVGDGIKDDTKAIKNAVGFSNFIIIPQGKYLITDTLELERKTLHGISQSWGRECELLSKTDIAVHLKGYNSLNNITISRKGYPDIRDTTKGLWLEGAFNRLNNVNVYNHAVGIYMTSENNGCVYNHIVDGVIANCFEGIYLLSQNQGWVNENTFQNISIRHNRDFHKYIDTLDNNLLIKDKFAVTMTYANDAIHPINMNKFLCMNMEGCYNGFYISALYCTFLSNRTEGNKIAYYFKDYKNINGLGNKRIHIKTRFNTIVNGDIKNTKKIKFIDAEGKEIENEKQIYNTIIESGIRRPL